MTTINASQLATVAPLQSGVSLGIKLSQLAVISVSYEPTFAANIKASQIAVVAASNANANLTSIQLSQIAIVVCCQELPWVQIIPPISLPNYLFSAIPYYVKR